MLRTYATTGSQVCTIVAAKVAAAKRAELAYFPTNMVTI